MSFIFFCLTHKKLKHLKSKSLLPNEVEGRAVEKHKAVEKSKAPPGIFSKVCF